MQTPNGSFVDRIEALDQSLFASIPSESYDGDRLAWLAVQRCLRRSGGYVYLEIGSHLGGSIQQHVVDPLCTHIISIDPRPAFQPDDRGRQFPYDGNSTARMLDNLRRIAPQDIEKLDCRDHDAKDIDPSTVRTAPDFCLIDGEHTHAAVLSDFEFCRKVAATDAVICFHDDIVIWRALREIEASLRSRKLPFTSRKFGVPVYGCTYGIFLGSCAVATDPTVLANSVEGGAWLRTRQLRSYVPGPLKAAARWCSGLLKRPARVA